MLRGAGCFLRAQSRSGDHTINSFTEGEKKSGTITFWGKTVRMDLFLLTHSYNFFVRLLLAGP